MATIRERDIERHLVKRVKELGGEVRKVRWIGRRGAPDRLVMLPERWTRGINTHAAAAIWVELKAPGKKAEPHQVREHERMRTMGQCVVVIDSIEGVEELLA
ncbi:VRR-NUC domain-containing protein [Aquabacterium sp.]|uniref:VRR-NUC domain-containing protein n=1 Tax=Aquabacterium sp. TaxID=1872578 RepID=UPI0040376EA5